MSKISLARKVITVARVAAQQARRNRTAAAIMNAAGATAKAFGHVLHELWLEVTGTVFIFMAAVGGTALVREWSKYHAGRATSGGVAIAICFTLTFAWFGVSSFWRVRHKGRGGAR